MKNLILKMKKLLSLLPYLFLSISFNCAAQNITQNKTELSTILCKTWKVDYALMNGMRINQLPNNMTFELEFKTDNSYFVIREKGKQKGKWNFIQNKKFVNLSVNNKIISRITKISENEMVVILISDGKINPPGLPNIEVYLKVK